MKRRYSDDSRLVKHIILGKDIPKSVGMMEIEEHMELLAKVVNHLIRKVEVLEENMRRIQGRSLSSRSRRIVKKRKKR